MATQEPGSIKELRDAADRGKKASQELDSMKREMAFLKAGVDTDTKVGQLLYKAYDGELDTESIQAEWSELSPVAATPPRSLTLLMMREYHGRGRVLPGIVFHQRTRQKAHTTQVIVSSRR